MNAAQNCHGCKYLDRYKENGRGYCCHVVRSKTQSEKVRTPEMERCELYAEGDFKTRHEGGESNGSPDV